MTVYTVPATDPSQPPSLAEGLASKAKNGCGVVVPGVVHPDVAADARVLAVWEGIRRTHGAPHDQAVPLMPPELFDVLDACPTTKVWKTKGRPSEPDLAGARDRALLLAALTADQLDDHPNGLVLNIPRSKTNQTGEQVELAVLPRAANPDRCLVTALDRWRQLAGITGGPLFRPVGKSNKPADRPLNPDSGQHPRPARRRPRRPRFRSV